MPNCRNPPVMRFTNWCCFRPKPALNLNEMYVAAAKNALYARQGRVAANDMAAETRRLFSANTNLMQFFNESFAGGRWDHFMDQPYIGYRSWSEPRQDNLGAVRLTDISVPDTAALGVGLDGSENAWPGATDAAALPQFDKFNQQRRYIDVFNRGAKTFDFTAAASAPWLRVSESSGTVEKDRRLWVSVDWDVAPAGLARGTILLSGAATNVTVNVEAFNPPEPARNTLDGFVEAEGFVSIEPEHFTRKADAGASQWIRIEDYGRTLSGMRASSPVEAPSATPGKDSPCLEYKTYLFTTGAVHVVAVTSPTLNFVPGRGLQFAESFDDESPVMVTLVRSNYSAQNGNRDWETSVKDNARFTRTEHTIKAPGYHTLKLWMVDPGVVLQKLVIDAGGVKPCYLGPPESYHAGR